MLILKFEDSKVLLDFWRERGVATVGYSAEDISDKSAQWNSKHRQWKTFTETTLGERIIGVNRLGDAAVIGVVTKQYHEAEPIQESGLLSRHTHQLGVEWTEATNDDRRRLRSEWRRLDIKFGRGHLWTVRRVSEVPTSSTTASEAEINAPGELPEPAEQSQAAPPAAPWVSVQRFATPGKIARSPLPIDISAQSNPPRCLIFEGVPGTGKTYALKPLQSKAGRDGHGAVGDDAFAITLHPATAYEDFVEGLRPAAEPSSQGGKSGGETTIHMGVLGDKVDGADNRYVWHERPCDKPFYHAPALPTDKTAFSVTDGFFVRCCRAAVLQPEKWFIVLLDEINRCNIPKVFGDLLTTIEQSKRARWVTITEGGETKQGWDLTNAQTVTLPYSGRTFFVPDNIIVIGTMNTTDRSVAPMDAALRRRFAFMRVWPFGFGPDDGNSNADTILDKLSAGDLAPHLRPSVELWLSINKRLHDFGDDALLGHSYLFALKDDLALAADDEEREATTIFHWNHYIFPQVIDIIQSNDLESKMFGSQKDDKDGKVLLQQVSDNKTGLYKEYRPGMSVEGTRRGEGMLRTLTLRLTKATVAGE
jgi:MoxR-like ATPase